MRSTFAPLAFAALAVALPQSGSSSCESSYSGNFQIQVVMTSSKRSLFARQDQSATNSLVLTLSDGKLMDDEGRTGYIASNHQFQFDSPVQAGAITQSGWGVCGGEYLALNGDTQFYQCLSGDFYNLYDESRGGQCEDVNIQVIGSGSSSGGSAPQTSVPVTQISDGQIQASTAVPVTQISDGQIQAPTSTVAPITQISDGQIQAPTSTAPVAPVTQISDGQIQAPTSAVQPVTQISDGQIQAPTGTGMAPSYYGNGTQPSSIVPAVGAAATAGMGKQIVGFAAAGIAAVAML